MRAYLRTNRTAASTRQQDRLVHLGEFSETQLGQGQIILMRKDPPVNAEFIYDTQLLSIAQAAGAQVINHPQGLRDLNEKLAAQLFPQCCPPTLISRDIEH